MLLLFGRSGPVYFSGVVGDFDISLSPVVTTSVTASLSDKTTALSGTTKGITVTVTGNTQIGVTDGPV